uniref:B3 domain-containing protein At2g32645-like n=1 Tax=Erigeron canadensis TaxID=72917 RepID=UPI001CB9B610|nr:B3 domain-containing protein At2g32645-like [Erigeron canadensis]
MKKKDDLSPNDEFDDLTEEDLAFFDGPEKEEAGGSLKRHHQDLNKNEKEEGGSSTKEPKTKKQRVATAVVQERVVTSEDDFLEYIGNQLKGTFIKFLIQKDLFASDLNPNLCRLNIPFKQVADHSFLRDQEKKTIQNENGITVGLVGPNREFHKKDDNEFEFSIWDQRSSQNYVLKKGWNRFVRDDAAVLKLNATIRLFSFRDANDGLCFGYTG